MTSVQTNVNIEYILLSENSNSVLEITIGKVLSNWSFGLFSRYHALSLWNKILKRFDQKLSTVKPDHAITSIKQSLYKIY